MIQVQAKIVCDECGKIKDFTLLSKSAQGYWKDSPHEMFQINWTESEVKDWSIHGYKSFCPECWHLYLESQNSLKKKSFFQRIFA